MPLISCKIELKLKWTKYCVLSANGNDKINANDNGNNIISTIKDRNFMFQLQLYQKETIKNHQTFLGKNLKDQFIGMNIKQKVRIKIRQMNKDIFSNQILFELINYLF